MVELGCINPCNWRLKQIKFTGRWENRNFTEKLSFVDGLPWSCLSLVYNESGFALEAAFWAIIAAPPIDSPPPARGPGEKAGGITINRILITM